MGKVISTMLRPLRDYNIENRAIKAISKNKRESAPLHERDRIDQERMLKEYSKEFEESLTKNEALDRNLKNVFVTSFDPELKAPANSSSANRPLPLDTSPVLESDFGFREPKNVPYGRLTLRSALELIQLHYGDPIANPKSKIALDYKLSEESVEKIIKYFRIHEVYIPEQKHSKANFIGPKVPRTQVFTQKSRSLPAGDQKEDT